MAFRELGYPKLDKYGMFCYDTLRNKCNKIVIFECKIDTILTPLL